MSESDLSRLRRDLDVIEEAAGLHLPFGWRDVWLALGLVPCGLVILLWAALGPWDHILVSLVPLVLLGLVAAGFHLAHYRRGERSRYLQHERLVTGLVAGAFALLIVWEKWLGLPAKAVRGAGLIVAGIMGLVLALTSRQRRVSLAATVVLVPFGIAVPLCSPQQVALVGGMAVTVAGLMAAGILAAQLRAEGGIRERLPH